MVKVLVPSFHDELAMPPLVKEKKEESSHSRVFELKHSEDRSPRRPNGQLEELSAAFKLTRQRPEDEAQTMRVTHPCALTALETADKVSP
jgi:hypothetical protein